MTFDEAVEFALSEEEHDPSTANEPDQSPAVEPTGNLTRREREVTVLVARGLTNRHISTQLSISERTAGNHVAKILRKLGLRSRPRIAAHAGVVVAVVETAPGMVASDE
jgi:non-specific serine/threonine protein kinase